METTIDPREAKLNNIIERGRASLTTTLEEIQQEFANRQDMMVKPTVVDFTVEGDTVRPVIRDQAYSVTAHSQNQIFQRAGIPMQFANKVMNLGETELLRLNLKRLTDRTQEDGIQIRRVGETIKGWLSPSYKRMDAAPVMESFLKRSIEEGLRPLQGHEHRLPLPDRYDPAEGLGTGKR